MICATSLRNFDSGVGRSRVKLEQQYQASSCYPNSEEMSSFHLFSLLPLPPSPKHHFLQSVNIPHNTFACQSTAPLIVRTDQTITIPRHTYPHESLHFHCITLACANACIPLTCADAFVLSPLPANMFSW